MRSLGSGGEAPLHSGELSDARIEAIANGTPIVIGEESPKASIAIIVLGAIASEAIKAQESLAARGAIANVYSACRLPLNRVAIERIAKQTDRIITLEEHNRVGALGSAVAEILADTQSAVKFDRLGLDDTFATIVGDQAYLRDAYRLNALATTKAIGACDFAKRDR